MYEYLKGNLVDKKSDAAVLDINGIGYFLDIPISTFSRLPAIGSEARFFVHHYIREDSQRLFGFYSEAEREIFRLLISINKIGPKIAIGILSNVPVKELIYAVNTQNASRLKGIPGIGLKTAERLVMELKGKINISNDIPGTSPISDGSAEHTPISVHNDVTAALVSLGYSDSQVQRAFTRVEQTVDKDIPIEEWIKRALQVM